MASEASIDTLILMGAQKVCSELSAYFALHLAHAPA